MQAIETKFLPVSNTKGARIKASCSAGSQTYDYYGLMSDGMKGGEEAMHTEAARRFKLHLAQVKGATHWDAPTVAGSLMNGNYVHVYV